MPRISPADVGGVNVCAFLDLISWSEGTAPGLHPLTRNDGYDVIVTGSDGPEVFDDYSAHPFSRGRLPKHISGSLYSTASGRYQHMRRDWAHYRDQLGLPDFGPLSQDRWAIQLIKERRAIPDIQAGDIASAITRCSNIWASFADAGYGQREHPIETLLQAYQSIMSRCGKLDSAAERIPMPKHWLDEVVTK